MPKFSGIEKASREKLAKILRAYPHAIKVKNAASILETSPLKAAQQLAVWNKQGWLSRVQRGIYVPVSLESESPDVPLDDPWIIAEELWRPCYIGGWSAAEHWDLTEQIFQSVLVMTTKKPRQRNPTLKDVGFLIHTVSPYHLFGTKPIWRGRIRVQVSDPSKTLVDMFDIPEVGGGIRPVADVYGQYLKSPHKNMDLLLTYAEQQGNGTIYKRMGFLTETLAPKEKKFLTECRKRLPTGYSKLDPSLKCEKIVTRWKLRVPISWKPKVSDD